MIDGSLPVTRGSMLAARRGMRSTRRRLAVGVMVLAISATGLTVVATGALFTGSATVTAGAFTTGTVTLSATPVTSALTLSNMAPGDAVTAPITVQNTGSLAQRYAVLSTTDALDANFLAAQLDLTIKTGVGTCDNMGFALTGTVVYATGDLGSTAGKKLIGDSATGAQAGDRTLAPAGSDVLCAQVVLPAGTGNTYETKTTTATLTFNAEQTVNNP